MERTRNPRPRPAEDALGFGQHFSDHMFEMEWNAKDGWHGARIRPYGDISLDPAASVFHYGQAMFDGFKAFRGKDGVIRVFRPDMHCARIRDGAKRMCLPSVDAKFVEHALFKLLQVEESWVPVARGASMYVRPTLIGTEPFLGVRPAGRCLFFIIMSPVGAYYAEGAKPVKIWVEQEQVRAARGGLGAVKAGANYAASLFAAQRARDRGYAQVLWLDAAEHRYLEEVGTMNLFLRIGDELITPPLHGSILPGVTRDSVLRVLRDWGLRVSERDVSLDEVRQAHAAGELREVFGCGTAAVISPVGELGIGDERLVIAGGGTGEIATRLYDELTGIQYGEKPDRYGWMVAVPRG